MHAFTARKESLLSKRDRSSRGRIDPHVVSTCSLLNLREEYCTLSSCSGRFYMYKGIGNKSGNNDSKKKDNRESGDLFDRFRICHEHLPSSPSAVRYFDLQTLLSDPTGGGDEIPDIAQYDYIDGAAGDAEEGEQETPGGGEWRTAKQGEYPTPETRPRKAGEVLTTDSKQQRSKHAAQTRCAKPASVLSPFQRRRSPFSRTALPFVNTAAKSGWLGGGWEEEVLCSHMCVGCPLLTHVRQPPLFSRWCGSHACVADPLPPPPAPSDQTIWLRYEPLILHIQTRSLLSADALLTASRAAGLKTCGLQSSCADKIIVFIIGEEGLEMPLTSPHGTPLFTFPDASDFLMKLVNDRQQRNWSKIERFNAALRALPDTIDNGFDSLTAQSSRTFTDAATMPKHFDVIGDVALLHSLPDGADPEGEPKSARSEPLCKPRAARKAPRTAENAQLHARSRMARSGPQSAFRAVAGTLAFVCKHV